MSTKDKMEKLLWQWVDAADKLDVPLSDLYVETIDLLTGIDKKRKSNG